MPIFEKCGAFKKIAKKYLFAIKPKLYHMGVYCNGILRGFLRVSMSKYLVQK